MIDRTGTRAPAAPLRALPPLSPRRCLGGEPGAGGAPPLVPILAAGDEVTPEVERALAAAVRAAQAGDRAARDAVYAALEAKLARFALGESHRARAGGGLWRDGRPWDAEDLAQEPFCLLADLIAEWPGDGPFVPYVLAYLPWRLRDARRRLETPRRFEAQPISAALEPLHDGSAYAEAARVLLEALAADLDPLDGAILLGVVRDGERLHALAARFGVDRRTVGRRWRALLLELRRSLLGSEDRVG